jgi:hypothetical protein
MSKKTVSTRNNGVSDRILLEIFRSLNRQQLGKFRSSSIDSALHRIRRTAAHLRSLGVRKSGRFNQYESSALLGRQLGQRGSKVVVFGVGELRRL